MASTTSPNLLFHSTAEDIDTGIYNYTIYNIQFAADRVTGDK